MHNFLENNCPSNIHKYILYIPYIIIIIIIIHEVIIDLSFDNTGVNGRYSLKNQDAADEVSNQGSSPEPSH